MSGTGNPSTSPTLWLLLLAVALIGILSMPREEYTGDPQVVRCETVALINNHDLSIPPPVVQGIQRERGTYLFENKFNHQFYSKYGILSSLLYVPSLLVEKWHDGKLDYYSTDRAIYLNWLNILLTIASAWYLYLIAFGYTASPAQAGVFVLTSFYCTFWWNYLRAQNSDIYQVLFLLGFYYHFTASFRQSPVVSGAAPKIEKRRDLILAGVFLGALILVKTVFVVLLPVAFLAFIGSQLGRPVPFTLLFRRAARIAVPLACALGVLLAVNAYKFGSPLETGWSQGGSVFGDNIFAGLYGFLFERGHSIFLYFPIFTFALFGYREFFKSYPLDTLLFTSIGILMLLLCAKVGDWVGGWGYGPRYILPYLPLLSLPFLKTIDFFVKNWRKWPAAACAVLVAGTLFWSFKFQLDVNSMPFFAYYKLEGLFVVFGNPRIDDYFFKHSMGEVDADLVAYKKGKPWLVFELMKPSLNPKGIAKVNDILRQYTASNYYFWPDTPRRH